MKDYRGREMPRPIPVAVIDGEPFFSLETLQRTVTLSPFYDGRYGIGETYDRRRGIATCRVRRTDSIDVIAVRASKKDAQNAGYWRSSPMWRRYPSRMLAMRARRMALEAAFPEVTKWMNAVWHGTVNAA